MTQHEEVQTRWGHYSVIGDYIRGDKQCKVKLLVLNPHQNISYQKHESRGENWTVMSGSGTLAQDGNFYEISQGVVANIPIGSAHAVQAGGDGLEIIEVQLGNECSEEDIHRYCMSWSDILNHARREA